MTNAAGFEGISVSRETSERLELFDALLHKWNPAINLVSRSSLKDSWSRHILDSEQIFRCVDPAGSWVDLGSGGGFPGIVVAIIAAVEAPDMKISLVESDQRKSAFLRTAARETGVNCSIISKRIEHVDPLDADILSARALADLAKLLGFAERHLSKTGTALFPKGATWEKEVEDAQGEWLFEAEPIRSRTNDEAVILKIKGVSRA